MMQVIGLHTTKNSDLLKRRDFVFSHGKNIHLCLLFLLKVSVRKFIFIHPLMIL